MDEEETMDENEVFHSSATIVCHKLKLIELRFHKYEMFYKRL